MNKMHIPDGFLDPKISAGLTGMAAVAMAYCVAKVREMATALAPSAALATVGKGVDNLVGGMKRVLTGDGEKLIYKMGMVAALIFAAQRFDFPVSQGASGHLFGGIFAAVILGPFAGAMVMAMVLVVQALFLADGGVIALGANIVNLAVIGTLLAYYLYSLIKKTAPEWLAIATAAWASVVLAAFACAVEIGFSGAAPLTAIVPAMVKVHSVIGVAEALITLGLIKIFRLL